MSKTSQVLDLAKEVVEGFFSVIILNIAIIVECFIVNV